MSIRDLVDGKEPWWATLLVKVGAPMAIIGLVLYFLLTSIAGNASAAASQSKAVADLMADHQKSTSIIARSTRRTERYFWIQCIRGSKTLSEQAICGSDPKERKDD